MNRQLDIKITNRAFAHIRERLISSLSDEAGLRLHVAKPGGTGDQYQADIIDEPAPTDVVYLHDDIPVYYAAEQFDLINGSVVAYEGIRKNARMVLKKLDISITEAALLHIRKHLKASTSDKAGLSVCIKPAGCTGHQYVANIADKPAPNEYTYLLDDIPIYYPTNQIEVIDGTVIEYEKQGLNAELFLRNKNAQETCGCGVSFKFSDLEAADEINTDLFASPNDE